MTQQNASTPDERTGEPVRNPITVLSEEESWELLGQVSLGRLALSVAGEPEIFPVNFYADGASILIRTAEGTKLLGLAMSNTVALEADGHNDVEGWSVIVKGRAATLESRAEILEADSQPLNPWVPTLKYNYVRITPSHISGRHFIFGQEPERY